MKPPLHDPFTTRDGASHIVDRRAQRSDDIGSLEMLQIAAQSPLSTSQEPVGQVLDRQNAALLEGLVSEALESVSSLADDSITPADHQVFFPRVEG